MRRLTYRFPAPARAPGRAHVGQAGSGDCEVLLEPGDEVEVVVRTSVDGFDAVWERVLSAFFARHPLAGRYEINDQGATPPVVSLRLRQAQEDARS